MNEQGQLADETHAQGQVQRFEKPRGMSPRKRAQVGRAIQYAVLVIIVAVLVYLADWAQITRTFFDPATIAAQFPAVVTTALKNTLIYTALGLAYGLAVGLVLALMRMSSVGPYRWIATIYIEFFRGVPALLVFLAFGYGIPSAFSVNLGTYLTVMLALGSVSSAYIAETIRAGLQAVPAGQAEAARTLGMSQSRAQVSIVIPQALRLVLPPLTNEVILLVKDSSLVFLLGVTVSQYELAKFGRDAISSAGSSGLTSVLVAGVCYLIITIPLALIARKFEVKTSRRSRS